MTPKLNAFVAVVAAGFSLNFPAPQHETHFVISTAQASATCTVSEFVQRGPTKGFLDPRVFTIFFAEQSFTLDPKAHTAAAEAAGAAVAKASSNVFVWGYTDTVGSEEDKRRLSLCRAGAVAAELKRLGVRKDAISIWGFGDDDPASPTADGNNRVVVRME